MQNEALLGLENLSIHVGKVPIIEAVSLDIRAGEMVGLVGESGSGKSVTALSVMRLLAEPPMKIASGSIRFDGHELTSMNETDLRALRGEEIAMIFQEPMTSLNPVFTIGQQIREMIRLHRDVSKRQADQQAEQLLARVGIPSPATTLRRYPHQLSGGQRQRVMIAIALACEPKLLIADEPTTALDVTIQAQILDLIDRLRQETAMAVLLITHDLGVVSQHCDRVAVMYLGRIVEYAAADELFANPRHRYTEALMRTIPSTNAPGDRLPAIAGTVPQPANRPSGCAFHPRCAAATARCAQDIPPLEGDTHKTACWNPVT
ncbi:ABC transporter ATP-binding protein [Ponticoccus sp. SC2-23]|uniref:ABC transporter ATP-binding protein n=1 Tax=Alexandriicola marinus TaxID=2081710 RepID=UPI000FD6D998|nr:ABC transporter ATP-binding protein [Alexandriicola marinus]MBM1218606.1 ABC transporter ATP-binding protein [Ponticoccus sp. SC6-9]MBM1224322.1 ABC transporter ATP-binding protein [Ponticoccus sp. SC6-15]MBM1229899.1 ABC transporter ATP-binding protein [Ponticoccus sp. SC6-38]MBM1233288.1 ABC transporter ATP-binding protein [Ponticoccus sp. SC6-45]MBM1236762.1 ABC transporter ATP-binding protein [Ponticoccus sp. SC6-49]MBM1242299.1 ABC transporter ATP-binding protein [Ponticoccus sp. SC2-